MGPATEVTMTGGNVAHSGPRFGDEDDMLLISMEFGNNTYAFMEYGSAFHWPEHYLMIQGTEGAIRIDMANVKMTLKLSLIHISIIHSKTFDNGMICASEQSVTVLEKVYDEARKEFAARGCYFLKGDEIEKVRKTIIINGALNAKIVGQTAYTLSLIHIFMRGKDAETLEEIIMEQMGDIEALKAEDRANKDSIRNTNKNYRSAFQKFGLVK